MKKILLALAMHLALGALWAQTSAPSPVVIEATDQLTRFTVDGVLYYGKATFFWTANSQHFLKFQSSLDGFQYVGGNSSIANKRFRFGGWEDTSGTLSLGSAYSVTVFAHPEVTHIRLNVTPQYRLQLQFWNAPPAEGEPEQGGCPTGTVDGPGVVYVGGTCFWRNTDFWNDAGELSLQAVPYPGWAFVGWGFNGSVPSLLTSSVNVQSAMVITVYFRVAKTVRFLTEPLGFDVLIDRFRTVTPNQDPCASWELTLPVPAPGAPSRCPGEVDWPLNTTHVIGAPSPQRDAAGNEWVFTSWSNGLGNHSLYDTGSNTSMETLVGKFVRGARATFLAQPSNLKLVIDGRDDWMSTNFVVAPGTVFEVTAPAEQVDAEGRKWVFAGWSNGGEATQQVRVPEEAVADGFRLYARYELLSQAVFQVEPDGVTLEVDGAVCASPCVTDRQDGTEVTVSVPETVQVTEDYRLEFGSWSDGGERTHTITVSGTESKKYAASFTKIFRLRLTSEPEGGARFNVEPASGDFFYVDGTKVRITVEEKEGYKFRRWGGDLYGTYNAGALTMNRPHAAIAMMDEIPYAPPAFVRNAAGETPEEIVAPGSIISIYGTTLAPGFEIGPANPLSQTLLGTTVMVDGRVLALLFVSPEQINAILHPDTAEGKHTLIVSRPGELDIETDITVARNAPGLFARVFDGMLFVMASHADGSPVTPDNPAAKGEVIGVYATGLGPYDKVAPFGFPLPDSPDYLVTDTVEPMAGEFFFEPESVRGAPGFSGTDLLEVRIGENWPSATTLEFKVHVNGRWSNTVLLPVE